MKFACFNCKYLICKWLCLLICIGFSAQAQATKCTTTFFVLAYSNGNASSVSNGNGAIDYKTSSSNTLTNTSLIVRVVVIPQTFSGGDSCFVSGILENQAFVVGNAVFTMTKYVTQGCVNDIGQPNGNQTYKGGANYASPWKPGAPDRVFEGWGCGFFIVDQYFDISVFDSTKPVGVSIDSQSLFKVSAGESSATLNGLVELNRSSPSIFSVSTQNATCAMTVPSTVNLPPVYGVPSTFTGMLTKSQAPIQLAMTCTNLSGITKDLYVLLQDGASPGSTLCSLTNTEPVATASIGVINLYMDFVSSPQQLCPFAQLFFSFPTNSVNSTQIRNMIALITIPPLPNPTVQGKIRSVLQLTTIYK